ncbi:hypothetical protein Trco_003609 [Trichoderma cornu-damae]|uniref:2EXR domain-containing protein n=1 Tax=Trichoderma cornu-damae TaxID=654480 RepID=A0A9P8TTE3_9HYPO|nr:hypothetical protein Trco_003609 [Trichoderma cornu-damae]
MVRPSIRPPTFARFPSFPPELRLQIWRECLPDLDGITLHKYKKGCWGPEPLEKAGSDEPQPAAGEAIVKFDFRHDMLDDVRFDVALLFVNREARGVALDWAREQGVELRFCEDRRRHVFVHPFHPLRDALFVHSDQWEEFCLEPYDRLAQPDLLGQVVTGSPELTRLAVPHTTIEADCSTVSDVFHWFPRLQVLFIILDVQADLTLETFLLGGDRERAKARLQRQQWKVGAARGRAMVWNGDSHSFEWRDGVGIGNTALYGQMEQVAAEMSRLLTARGESGSSSGFEIQPVFAVRVTTDD